MPDAYGTVRNAVGWGARKDTLPVGAVVIRKRDSTTRTRYCRFIKVRMDGGPQEKWRPYARWWWEKNKGPVPAGKLVLHRDGDELNDDPKNLILGTSGMKLVLAHQRDPKWSKEQHRRAASGCAEWNRKNGRINRASNFLQKYWYPVIDDMTTILNIPFRRRKRILGCFGLDVSRYPSNGVGKNQGSVIQKLLKSTPVRPTKGSDLSLRRYETYCLIEPTSKKCTGPMSTSGAQLIAHLDRMGIWQNAVKYAGKDLRERK